MILKKNKCLNKVSVDDIYKMVAIAANQAIGLKASAK